MKPRVLIPVILAAAQIAMSAGLPLVTCTGADGHVRVEIAHATCAAAVNGDSSPVERDEPAAESRPCADTPIGAVEAVSLRTSERRDAHPSSIESIPVTSLGFLSDRTETIAPRWTDESVCSDMTLLALRTVVLTV